MQTFLTSASGVQTTGQTSLMQLSSETGSVLNGSYIVFSCVSGYVNTGGSLNVTCSSSGSWSSFPNCVLSGGGVMPTTTMTAGGGQMTTTIVPPSGGSPCVIDPTSTFNITNGYPTTLSLLYTSSNAATGNKITWIILSVPFDAYQRVGPVCLFTWLYTQSKYWCIVCL